MKLTLNLKVPSKSKNDTEMLFQQIKEAVEKKIGNTYPEVDEVLVTTELI